MTLRYKQRGALVQAAERGRPIWEFSKTGEAPRRAPLGSGSATGLGLSRGGEASVSAALLLHSERQRVLPLLDGVAQEVHIERSVDGLCDANVAMAEQLARHVKAALPRHGKPEAAPQVVNPHVGERRLHAQALPRAPE